MKKMIILIIGLTILNCGAPKTINGKRIKTYGLFNEKEQKDPCISYDIIEGNLVWSVLTISSIVLPLYFIGYSLYNPVEKKDCKDSTLISNNNRG